MPRWFIQGPIQDADETELKAYKALNELDDQWSIRWTYEYLDEHTPKEGDFLILGPDGCLLVLEVKTRARVYPQTGTSDGGDGKNHEEQVQSQKAGVIAAMKQALAEDSANRTMPFIGMAIFSLEGSGYVEPNERYPIALIKGVAHLARLPEIWKSLMSGRGSRHPSMERERNLFHAVYGDSSVEAEGKFLQSTDRLILERISADMEILEGLRGNQQILVRGGAGSGKTWMAEHLAEQWAKEGKHVLFLCYNRALGENLRQDFTKVSRSKNRGCITVHTWESLADWLTHKLPKASQAKVKPPEQRDNTYYETVLPELMTEAVLAMESEPPFDALVVDEAQDQDIGWWELYYELLRERKQAPMGIFYDPAQRPDFRRKKSGDFDIQAVAKDLSQPAHFHIRATRRYTRPLFYYLRALQSPETAKFLEDMPYEKNLLAGPDVIEINELATIDAAKIEAGKLLSGWLKNGLLDASDVLLLTRHNPFEDKRRWFIDGEPFATKTIVPADAPNARAKDKLRVTSFHKSKGLDAKAVILLDTMPWDQVREGDREGYWIAASRARQLLAVLTMRK